MRPAAGVNSPPGLSPSNPRPVATMSTSIPAHTSPAPITPAPISVVKADLPLSCPLPGAAVWNMHPKVYLPIEASGQASCPYCGASYVLQP